MAIFCTIELVHKNELYYGLILVQFSTGISHWKGDIRYFQAMLIRWVALIRMNKITLFS